MAITFDSETLRLMMYFKQATRVSCRDCFEVNGIIVFVTDAKETGLAVGKGGMNKKALESSLHKKVKILGHAENPVELTRNFLVPMQATDISLVTEDGKDLIKIQFPSPKERRILLSNNLENLKLLKAVMARYFPNIANILVLQ
ncbi:MAG: NusA-like transcription termination signal-binding factor [archaeon]